MDKKARKQRANAAQGLQPKPFSVASNKERSYTEGNLRLLETADFADAQIVANDTKWRVHKTILSARSAWFRQAFLASMQDGNAADHIPVINLHNFTRDDIDNMLHFIYAGSLNMARFALHNGTLLGYARLFRIATTFELPELLSDAKTLLGQLCDQHLLTICAYDPALSGRNGVLTPTDNPFVPDLLSAITLAFSEPPTTDLQLMLASFAYGARSRLFSYPAFANLAVTCPEFGNTIFKLMLPGTPDEYAPVPVAVSATGVDHSHRSQHPDRCACCSSTFRDTGKSRKGGFNPFDAHVRAATYCMECWQGKEGGKEGEKAPLFRMEPQEERSH